MKKFIALFLLVITFLLTLCTTAFAKEQTSFEDKAKSQKVVLKSESKENTAPVGASNNYTMKVGETKTLYPENPYGSGFVSSASWRSSSSYYVSIINSGNSSCTISANRATISSVTIYCDYVVRMGSYPQTILNLSQKFYITVTNESGGSGGGGGNTTQYVTVNFDANGGETTESSWRVKKGETCSFLLPSAYREGYSFNGWYTLPEGGARVRDYAKYSQNTTLYAHWTWNNVDIGINKVTVSNVTSPKAGNTPTYYANVATSANYKVQNYSSGDFKNGVAWFNETDEKSMTSADRFIGGKKYSVHVYLEPNTHYAFYTTPDATINGLTAQSSSPLTDGTICVTYTFNCEAIKPEAPTLTLSAQGNGLLASWNKVNSASKYIVYYKKYDAAWETAETTNTSYALTDLDSGSTYYVKVQSLSAYSIEGNYSSTKSITFVSQIKPTVTLSNTDSGIHAEWTAAKGATKYNISYKKYGDNYWNSIEVTDNNYSIPNLTAGSKYGVKVQPIYGNEKGATSSVVWLAYIPQIKPVLSLYNKSNGIYAEWTNADGATKYIVYYKKDTDSKWNSTETVNNHYSLLNLTTGTKYAVQIQPIYGSEKGIYSYVVRLVFIVPSKPTLTLSNKSNGIRADWTKDSNATKYVVYFKKDTDSNWNSVETSNAYYPLLNLTAGTKYAVQVLPIYGSSKGAYSAVSRLVYVPQVKPAVTLSNKNNGIRAEWKAIGGATKYIVYFKKDADSKWNSVETANTYYPLLNIAAGTKYAVQVQPLFNSSKGLYSAVGRLVYIPQVKPVVTLSVKSNGIRAEWKVVTGATKYIVYYKKSADSKWSSTETTNTYYPLLKLTKSTKYSVQVQPLFGTQKGLYSKVASQTY